MLVVLACLSNTVVKICCMFGQYCAALRISKMESCRYCGLDFKRVLTPSNSLCGDPTGSRLDDPCSTKGRPPATPGSPPIAPCPQVLQPVPVGVCWPSCCFCFAASTNWRARWFKGPCLDLPNLQFKLAFDLTPFSNDRCRKNPPKSWVGLKRCLGGDVHPARNRYIACFCLNKALMVDQCLTSQMLWHQWLGSST